MGSFHSQFVRWTTGTYRQYVLLEYQKVAAKTFQYRLSAVRVIIIALSVVRNGRTECLTHPPGNKYQVPARSTGIRCTHNRCAKNSLGPTNTITVALTAQPMIGSRYRI
jgi:hypothetical protein